MNTGWLKSSFIYLLIIVASIALFFSLSPLGSGKEQGTMTIGDVVQQAKEGSIKKISVQGDELIIERRDTDTKMVARKEPNANVYEILRDAGVTSEQVSKM